jgi:cytochrome c2
MARTRVDAARPPRSPAAVLGAAALALVVAGAAGYGAVTIRDRQERYAAAAAVTGGDPALGPDLMIHYGCSKCHTIPGVREANGLVGPPLAGVSRRVYLGGSVVNGPEQMVRWILNPKAFDADTVMPATGITEPEARHVAAYLNAID